MKRRITVLGLAAALTTAQAAGVTPPPVLSGLPGTARITVIERQDMPDMGLAAWITLDNGQPSVFFTDPAGERYMLLGALIGADGRNLTAEILAQHQVKPDYTALLATLEDQAKYVQDGTKGRVAYVFFDPNCIYCKQLWADTRNLVQSGVLQLRWVPVAFLAPDSMGKSVAILSAPDPLAALAQNNAGYDDRLHRGGIAPAELGEAVREPMAAVLNHGMLMQRHAIGGTPAMVYRDGTEVKLIAGAPGTDHLTQALKLTR